MPDHQQLASEVHYALEQAVYKSKAESFANLLRASHVSLDGITITCNGSQYLFHAENEAAASRLAAALPHFFTQYDLGKLNTEYLDVKGLVNEQVASSQGADAAHKAASQAMFLALAPYLSYETHASQKHLAITFPGLPDLQQAYATILRSLELSHIQVRPDGSLIFNIHEFLQTKPTDALRVIKRPDNSAVLVLNTAPIEAKQLFVAPSDVPEDDDQVKLQPFFTAPRKAPHCRFLLDVSDSMNEVESEGKTRLVWAKQSLLELAVVLFQLHPDAKLEVQTFYSETLGSSLILTNVGTMPIYNAQTISSLADSLNNVEVCGATPLFAAATHLVTPYLDNAKGFNSIVFTDGQDNGSLEAKHALEQLIQTLSQLEGEALSIERTTNKFSIISCGAQQPENLVKLCEQFGSSVLNVNQACFTSAPGSEAFLSEFLQRRELLTCQATISHADPATGNEIAAAFACHGSGQLVEAPAIICPKGSQIDFKVTDAEGHEVVGERITTLPAISSSSHSFSTVAAGTSSNTAPQIKFYGSTRTVFMPKPVPSSAPVPSSSTSYQSLVPGQSSSSR